MPHLTVEYSNNIKKASDIPTLLQKINETLLQHSDIIPIGGLRSRAIELEDYCVADGTEDDAFVHVCLMLAQGRTEEQIRLIEEELFKTVKAHFATLFNKRYLALSLAVEEYQRTSLKQNNIHQRYKK